MRPYTPVDQTLVAASHHPSQESDLYLMIKVYPDGMLTPHLNSLHVGKSQPVCYVSKGEGRYSGSNVLIHYSF